MSEPNVNQVIAGPAQLYSAPVGTAIPTAVSTSPATWPPVWAAPWQRLGYTEKGVDLVFTPSIKGFTPDEEAFPIYDIFESAKCDVSAILWEATLENYNRALSASTFTDDGISKRTVATGTTTLTYISIAFQGPAPATDTMSSPATTPLGRVLIVYKAIVTSAISLAMTRKDLQKFSCKWEARKIQGQDLYDLYEIY